MSNNIFTRSQKLTNEKSGIKNGSPLLESLTSKIIHTPKNYRLLSILLLIFLNMTIKPYCWRHLHHRTWKNKACIHLENPSLITRFNSTMHVTRGEKLSLVFSALTLKYKGSIILEKYAHRYDIGIKQR